MKKGITGHQMAIIMSIIVAIVVIALVWVFLQKGSEGISEMFDKIIASFYQAMCGLMGSWGSLLFPGMC